MAIQDITLVVKTKVDQLNKLEKSIDNVEKKVGKISKLKLLIDTTKADRDLETTSKKLSKLNDELVKATKYAARFDKDSKGFTGVRNIRNEVGLLNQQLKQAQIAFEDTSKAANIYEKVRDIGKDKAKVRALAQENAALASLAITYKRLRIENSAYQRASARLFNQKGTTSPSLTDSEALGSIERRTKALSKWPKTLDASSRALEEIQWLLNHAVKDSDVFNHLAKSYNEMVKRRLEIEKAITPEKKEQTVQQERQLDFLDKQLAKIDGISRAYKGMIPIFSQLKDLGKYLGLGTQLGSSALLLGGGAALKDLSGLLKNVGLGQTGIGKSVGSMASTATILGGVDALGKLALGAQGVALAADQAGRSFFELERKLAEAIPKAFGWVTGQGRKGWDRHSQALGGAGIRPSDIGSIVPSFMRMAVGMGFPNEAKDDALYLEKQALEIAQKRLAALGRMGLEAKEYADTALYVKSLEKTITDEIQERELSLRRAADLTRADLTTAQKDRVLSKAEVAAGRFKKTQRTGFAAFDARQTAIEQEIILQKRLKGELISASEIVKRTNRWRKEAVSLTERLFSTQAKNNRRIRALLKIGGKKAGISSTPRDLESMMLGAGFPMLFGGGVGSVGGSILGSAGAAMAGISGFGPQILGSAVGTQLEQLHNRVVQIGNAAQSLNLDNLEESGIRVNAQLELQINKLKKAGEFKKAEAAIDKQVFKQTGALGGTSQDISNNVAILSNVWGEFQAAAGMTLGILLTPIVTALTAIVKLVNIILQGVNLILSLTGKIFKWAIEGILKRLPKGQELLDWINKKIEDMNKNLDEMNMKFGSWVEQMREEQQLLLEKITLGEQEAAIQADIRKAVAEIGIHKKDEITKIVQALHLTRQQYDEYQKIQGMYKSIGGTIKNGIVDSLEAAIMKTKSLGDVASNVFRMIARSLLQFGVNSLLGGMFGGTKFGKYLGVGGGKTGDVIESVVPDVTSNTGSLSDKYDFTTMATGGPVTGNTPYIIGEKGPELFVPNSSGTIVPNHAMGGSMVINVDASGSSVEGDAERSRQLGELIGAAVQSEIIRQQRPGGTLF